MVYIFDDRAYRREENHERLKKYTDLIRFETVKTVPNKPTAECVFDMVIESPECIIFHKSYVFADNTVDFESIRAVFISFGVPIVIFSGGTEGANRKENEIDINADLMYENLPYFLEDLRINGKININVLLWGERHKLNALLEFENRIAEICFINHDLQAFIENVPKIRRTIENLTKKEFKELGELILTDLDKIGEPTWLDLRNIVESNIKKIK
ncbi:MAG: hypothetical protein J1F05_02965 [Muribaculaceae bacterium]|nr:hypothetical protein [Muribaculaceae bacterium]